MTGNASPPLGFRLSVTSLSFTPEGDDPDGPHANEHWRLEFFPSEVPGLPHENVIFVKCERNYDLEDALENRILITDEVTKHSMMTSFAETTFREKGWYNFEIVNSQAVAIPSSPIIDLPLNYRVIPYTSLEPCEGTLRAGEAHRLVNGHDRKSKVRQIRTQGEMRVISRGFRTNLVQALSCESSGLLLASAH